MKHLILKLCIAGGLLMSIPGLSQTGLDDESNTIKIDSLSETDWYSETKIDHDDPAYLNDKSYVSGNYTIFYPASGFSPISSNTELRYYSAGCSYRFTPDAAFDAFDLQLQIPDGHEIRGMWYYYYDSNTSSSNATLYAVKNDDGTYTAKLSTNTIGDSGYSSHYSSLSPNYILVNNIDERYSLRMSSQEQGSSQRLCGIRLLINSTP